MKSSTATAAAGKHFDKWTIIVAFSMFLILVAAGDWGLSGDHVVQVATDRDKTYRLDFKSPNHLQSLLHADMEDAGFVQLYRISDNRLMATSQMADFFGGNARVTWLMGTTGQVSVGCDVMFWHVHPISPRGAPLPIQHEIGP